MEANGYKRTISDPCLFTKFTGNHRTYCWTHVDDTFVASSDPNELLEFQRVVGLKYKYTVNTSVDSYLGTHMTHLDDGVLMTQPKLLAEIFDEYKPHLMPGTTRVTAPRKEHVEDDWDETPIPRSMCVH